MRYFDALSMAKEFDYVMYMAGGNYKVCVEINNIAYLVSDHFITYLTVQGKIMNSKEVEELWEKDSDEMYDTDNYTFVAEWQNSIGTFNFLLSDKDICDVLFDKVKKFRNIIGIDYNPTRYTQISK